MDCGIVLRDDPGPEDNIKVMSPKGCLYLVNEEGARVLLSKGWSIYLGGPLEVEDDNA